MGFITNFFDQYVRMPVSTIAWNDIVEIILFAAAFYHILTWIRRSRAWTFLRAAVILLFLYVLARVMQLNNLLQVFHYVTTYIVIGGIILLQPEIRRALEQLGRRMQLTRFFSFSDAAAVGVWYPDAIIDSVVRAASSLGRTKTGALIVIERNILLNEYIATGINLNADVSAPLLEQIFEHNTPLHDGAVIIRDSKILAATCYLPLSSNMHISKELGTRHRAGLGISEVSDSITVIVSEETGGISVARDGMLHRNLTADEMRRFLEEDQKKSAEKGREGSEKGMGED